MLTAWQVSQMEVEIQGMPQSIKQQFAQRAAPQSRTLLASRPSPATSPTPPPAMLCSPVARRPRAMTPTVSASAALGCITADSPYAAASTDARTRLLQGNASLADGSRRLEESQRIALETEDIGAGILRDLGTQREQIQHARETVRSLLPPCCLLSLTQNLVADCRRLHRQGQWDPQVHDQAVRPPPETPVLSLFICALKPPLAILLNRERSFLSSRSMYQQRIVTGAIIAVLVLVILIILYEKIFA